MGEATVDEAVGLREALERGESRVMVTVTGTRGSTPRKVGARMLLRPDGSFSGTIGGGCGEAEVWQEAMETMADGRPRLVQGGPTGPGGGGTVKPGERGGTRGTRSRHRRGAATARSERAWWAYGDRKAPPPARSDS